MDDRVVTVSWDVDDRRTSLVARVYIFGMRLMRDKRAFEGEERTLGTARKRQRSGDSPPTRWTRLRRRVTTETVAGMTVWTVRPKRTTVRSRVLYVHGGGYVHPLTPDYWRLVRALSSEGTEVVVPAYPLAPDATVDDVLPRLVALGGRIQSDQIPTVLMGDSAGGALVMAIAQQIRQQGGRQAAAIVALCPWLDPTLAEAGVQDLESTDPMLAESGLRAAGRWWAGTREPTDPLVSPLEAGLDDLPPVDVFIGDRDILRPAVDDLGQRAHLSEVSLYVHEVPAMFHVWMTRAIPEGRRTRKSLAGLVQQRAARAVAG